MTSAENSISISNINVSQRELLVLKNVELTLQKGEFVYLIGKTGSGKSSLLKILYGELRLKEGNATVAGFNLIKLRKRKILALRRKLGIVFQDFQLLTDRTVEENLKFVMRATGWKDKKKVKARTSELLEKVGMAEKGFKFPHQLSGGEQQRIAIARALINDPEIILADEPTGNLDPEKSNKIIELLQEINAKGTTILIATHDYSIIKKYKARTLQCANQKISEIVMDHE